MTFLYDDDIYKNEETFKKQDNQHTYKRAAINKNNRSRYPRKEEFIRISAGKHRKVWPKLS